MKRVPRQNIRNCCLSGLGTESPDTMKVHQYPESRRSSSKSSRVSTSRYSTSPSRTSPSPMSRVSTIPPSICQSDSCWISLRCTLECRFMAATEPNVRPHCGQVVEGTEGAGSGTAPAWHLRICASRSPLVEKRRMQAS